MMDWLQWHEAYDDAGSSLARRLEVVRRHVADALNALGPDEPQRILSLCAGDGRDLLPELEAQPARARQVVLVEKDPTLTAAAAERARVLGPGTTRVILGDAGELAMFADCLPVDLLLLCGIFGNVSDDDIE
ncbi:MAG: class I SAM-dependent methyltransferase, partial [Mycobacteriales bacterium]